MPNSQNKIILRDLFAGIDCQFIGPGDITLDGLANDSRRVKPGDLFFAIPGFSSDGRKYVTEAISLGAIAIASNGIIEGLESVPQVICADVRRAMSKTSARFFGIPSAKIPVVGVTGTNGKTTTTYMFAHIMKVQGQRWGRLGTVDYFTGGRVSTATNTTPDALQLQEMLAEIYNNGLHGCVMEVSSHGLDLGRCDDIQFSAAVFTNLSQDHLDYHKDMESYFLAKSILFEKLLRADGFVILNARDPYSERLRKLSPGRVITFGVVEDFSENVVADLIIADRDYADGQRSYKARFAGKTIDGSIPHLGRFNLFNAAAAIGAAIGLGCSLEDAVESLRTAPQVPGRVQKIDCGQPFEVIIDYAHTPDAIKNLLEGIHSAGKVILVFGCGGDRDTIKRPIMGGIACKLADRVVVTSDNPRTEKPAQIIADILKGMPAGDYLKVIENRDEAIGQAIGMAKAGDLVIIAGKGHEDYQIIGKTKLYFSDQDVARKYLKKLGYAAG